MATILERQNKDGSMAYRTAIREKGVEEYKTFFTREDAEAYIFYRTRLINLMHNFDIPIESRVTLKDVVELKKECFTGDARQLSELELIHKRFSENLKPHEFLAELKYEDWLETMNKFLTMKIPARGGCRTMVIPSLHSIARWFAGLSAAFSYAMSKGIPIENIPLKVLQTKINPILKESR